MGVSSPCPSSGSQHLAATQPALDAQELRAANRAVWQAYWPEVEEQWTLGALDTASLSREAWGRTLRACGCHDETVVQLAVQMHLQFGREAHRLFKDVAELFSSLTRADIPLALVTNGASDAQRDKLQVLGIEQWFETIVTSGEVGLAKPQAAIFRLAIDRLGVEPDRIWHVGDSPVTDVAGAQAAGISAVWLNRRGLALTDSDPPADLEIRSLAPLGGLAAQ